MVPVVTRRCAVDDEICGHRIPAGTYVACSIQARARRKRILMRLQQKRCLPDADTFCSPCARPCTTPGQKRTLGCRSASSPAASSPACRLTSGRSWCAPVHVALTGTRQARVVLQKVFQVCQNSIAAVTCFELDVTLPCAVMVRVLHHAGGQRCDAHHIGPTGSNDQRSCVPASCHQPEAGACARGRAVRAVHPGAAQLPGPVLCAAGGAHRAGAAGQGARGPACPIPIPYTLSASSPMALLQAQGSCRTAWV